MEATPDRVVDWQDLIAQRAIRAVMDVMRADGCSPRNAIVTVRKHSVGAAAVWDAVDAFFHAPFARPDLFVRSYVSRPGGAVQFVLQPGLSELERHDALALVCREYDPIGCGTCLMGNEIRTYSCE